MIVAFPAATPVTTPVALIVAVPEALLVQIPPVVALFKVVEPPTQVVNVPVGLIGLTDGKLVTVELGINIVKSVVALEDVMLRVPVYVPAVAVALNLILTVVVTVPADACVIEPVLEYDPLAIDISKPAGAVNTIVLLVVVNVPDTVKV